jgi:hypothetical protein
MKLRISCKESARRITGRLDRKLPWFELVVLRMHVMACKACPRFERQVRLMDEAMGRWRGYANQGD